MRQFLSFLLLCIAASGFSQAKVGEWRDHLPYHQASKVVKIGDKIYTSTPYNIFTYNIKDNSTQKLSTITGLSEINISTMEYYTDKDILLIAYSSGNIDLLKGQTITNIPDLKNKTITGSKEANSIYFKDDLAYICYPFGIIVINLEKNEVKDTWYIGAQDTKYNVYALTSNNSHYYAATSGGVYKADINNSFLTNYANWKQETGLPTPSGRYTLITNYNGSIIANYSGNSNTSDSLFQCVNETWSQLPFTDYSRKYELRVFNNNLTIAESSTVVALNSSFQVVYSSSDFAPRSIWVDDDQTYWVADNNSGLSYKKSTGGLHGIIPSGPYYNQIGQLYYNNGTIYGTGGAVNSSWIDLWRAGYIYTFHDEKWTDIFNYNAQDYMYMAFDPSNSSTYYAGSWRHGLMKYNNGALSDVFNSSNSTLQATSADGDNCHIGGLTFDSNKNLWVVNSSVASPVSVLKADGTWKSFKYGDKVNIDNKNTQGPLLQDTYGQFWMVIPRGGGLFVFDPKDIDNDDDDVTPIHFYPKDAYESTVTNIFCIANDLDDEVWIGTDHGPIYFPSPDNVFEGETTGEQPTIPRNDGSDNVDPLLAGETVNCIAIDGSNRKWFGTASGGAFMASADGTKQIYHFNTSNSPIFSNNVLSIAIQGNTGEVFFGTDKGLISFRAVATDANDNFTNVYVYPNPVRPNYSGDIVITGLIANCHVKITDISGNLVYACKSDGGSASWDGKVKGGRRASSGVYLVFLSNDDGSKTYQTKFLMIH